MTIRQMHTWWFIHTTGNRTTAQPTAGESTPAADIGSRTVAAILTHNKAKAVLLTLGFGVRDAAHVMRGATDG